MATPRSTINWKARLVLVGALAGALGGVLLATPSAEAAPTQSIYRTYYNNASFGSIVGGRWILKCGGGGGTGWGNVTQHYVQLTAPCSGSSPPLELCFVDGSPDICPPGV